MRAHAAWSAFGVGAGQDHASGAGIIEPNEQLIFTSFPCHRNSASGHPLRHLPAHRGLPARHPQRGADRALPPRPSRSARPSLVVRSAARSLTPPVRSPAATILGAAARTPSAAGPGSARTQTSSVAPPGSLSRPCSSSSPAIRPPSPPTRARWSTCSAPKTSPSPLSAACISAGPIAAGEPAGHELAAAEIIDWLSKRHELTPASLTGCHIPEGGSCSRDRPIRYGPRHGRTSAVRPVSGQS